MGTGNYAPIDSPNFTGFPTTPSLTSGDNSTRIANTNFVHNAILSVSGGDLPYSVLTLGLLNTNSYYTFTSPYGTSNILILLQAYYNGIWADPYWSYDAGIGYAYGVRASHYSGSGSIVVHTGFYIIGNEIVTGSAHNATGPISGTISCRAYIYQLPGS